jgi:hypothetical protein
VKAIQPLKTMGTGEFSCHHKGILYMHITTMFYHPPLSLENYISDFFGKTQKYATCHKDLA